MNLERHDTCKLLSRRRFVKLSALGTATSLLGGRLWRQTVWADMQPDGTAGGTFKIRISDYPGLQTQFGSVRLGINPVRPDSEPFPDGDFYPILVTRDAGGRFYALDAECRHAGCVVPTPDDVLIICPCHGSAYEIDGTVVAGPATASLRRYVVEFDGADTLRIFVPAWGFATTVSLLPGGSGSHLKLEFFASPKVQYQVNFRQHAGDAWGLIPFFDSPDASTGQTTLLGKGASETVYVPRMSATGFYAVAMKLNEV
jgi:Rieske Fe-S protein